MNYKETIAWLYEQFPYYQKDGNIRLEEEYDDSGTVRVITDY